MVTSDLGACEWFVWDLRRSGLIDRGQLDQVVGDFLKHNARAEPAALAEHLIGKNVLTPFQAERILTGKTQGLVLGSYVLSDAIGSGSMGQVYKAQSKTDGLWYAVKVLPRRSMWNVRLARRQVRSFSQFSHPAVVPFVDVGTSGGQHFLVWPLVEGETLESQVQREGALAPAVAANLLTQVAEGLAAAHQQGIFHGLLKPSNILIGSDGQARILDFGIGSLLAENDGESLVDTMSTANTLTSGLDCASPESIMEPTNRTTAGDQYSFGCVLYYVLAGQYPFADGTAVEKMMAHQFKQPTPLREAASHVPEGLAAIVERLMQKSPDNRYPGVDEVAEALEPFGAEAVKGSRFGSSPPAPSRSGGSHFGSHPGLSPASHSGSRLGTSAAPLPTARPAPSSVQVPTPKTGPLTPPPARAPSHLPPVAPARPAPARSAPPPVAPSHARGPALPPVAAPRPQVPTRAKLREVPLATPAAVAADMELPVALPLDMPDPSPRGRGKYGRSPRWDDGNQPRGMSTFLVFLIAALVTAGMYVIGKTVLFAN